MKIFISWSGEKSKQIALILKKWLGNCIQTANIFVSDIDIASGSIGLEKIRTELRNSNFGILCITNDNLNAPWICFESAAIAFGGVDDLKNVAPLLFGLNPKDLSGHPLGQFQAKQNTKEGLWQLVRDINQSTPEQPIEESRLQTAFDSFYDKLNNELSAIPTDISEENKRVNEDEINGIFLKHLRDNNKTVLSDINQLLQQNGRMTQEEKYFSDIGKGICAIVAQYKHLQKSAEEFGDAGSETDPLYYTVLELICGQFSGVVFQANNPSPMWIRLREKEYFVLFAVKMCKPPKLLMSGTPTDVTYEVSRRSTFGFKMSFSRELTPNELSLISFELDARLE